MHKKMLLFIFWVISLNGMAPRRIILPEDPNVGGFKINQLCIIIGVATFWAGVQLTGACLTAAEESCFPLGATAISGAALVAGGFIAQFQDKSINKQPLPMKSLVKWVRKNPQNSRLDAGVNFFLARAKVVRPNVYMKIDQRLDEIREISAKNKKVYEELFSVLPLPAEMKETIRVEVAKNLRDKTNSLRKMHLTQDEIKQLLESAGVLTDFAARRDPTHTHENNIYCEGIVYIDGEKICNALTTAYIRLRFPHVMCQAQ